MKTGMKSKVPAKLARARMRFEKWRGNHKPRTRFPENLWTLAVELAREYGLNRTVQALRLDYYSLKKRLDSSFAPEEDSRGADTPDFVELFPSGISPYTECTVEFEDGMGSKMRIHLKGPQVPDLGDLCRSFWGHEE